MSSERDVRNTSPGGFPERLLPEDLAEGRDHVGRYLFAALWAPGQRVLDVGCGVGYGSAILFGAGARQVTGLDVSADAIGEAVRRFGREGLQFSCADVVRPLPVTEQDVVVAFEIVEHVADGDALMSGIARALTADGIAILSTPNAAIYAGGYSGNPYHLHEYQQGELERLLRRHFREVALYFQWWYNDPFEAPFGLGHVARLITPRALKHFLRTALSTPATRKPSFANPGISGEDPLRFRPHPISYLQWPGLGGVEPNIWVAVCRKPIRP